MTPSQQRAARPARRVNADRNVAELLWDSAARAGSRVAMIERERTTDYATLGRRAAAIGIALTRSGIRPGDRVAVFLERGADAAAALFGVAAIGAVAILINEKLRTQQIEYVLRHSMATALVTRLDLLALQPRPLETTARILDVATIPSAGELKPLPRLGSDVALIIYTSGSTGLPKGVTISHANLWEAMATVVSYLELGPDDRIASLLPFSFVYGLSQLLCAVGTSASLVIERSPLAQQMVAALRANRVTVLAAVPPLWAQLLVVPTFRDQPLPSLRVLTNAGGGLSTIAVGALRRAQPQAKLFLMYGMTETLRSTYLPPDKLDRRPDSIGRAIPGADILVLRDDLTPSAPGEVGELVHRGPTVTLGYWNDPEGTARVFRPNPLRPPGAPDGEHVVFSGDLVRRDAEGFLYYVGRRDRMIKTLGYRVSPEEVANALHASGEISEGVVTAEPDPQRGLRIVAHVALAPGGSLERLKAYCDTELPFYMQPARFDVRDALPRLASGKHDVVALAAPRDDA